jgi:hypothetical protein
MKWTVHVTREIAQLMFFLAVVVFLPLQTIGINPLRFHYLVQFESRSKNREDLWTLETDYR